MRRPSMQHSLRTALVTLCLGVFALTAFFRWFDAWAALEDAVYELNAMARTLADQGKPREAEALYRTVLGIGAPRVGSYPGILMARNDLGRLLARQGRYAECESEFAALIQEAEASVAIGGNDVIGLGEAQFAWMRSNYGECLLRGGEPARARAEFEIAHAILMRAPQDSRGVDVLRINSERLRQVREAGAGDDAPRSGG